MNPPTAKEIALANSLKQTLFALESVLMLASGSLQPSAGKELVKYAESARRTLEDNAL